ncbi:NfeD family protein [Paenibacillus cremeus]|uniref:Nodulation protein NfeD n=1 Tax=Paenibacillus cremeus TaxID=2163881 RepID=A0A559KC00_9BACL|nr:nodulation protein NfeD [Paenibacillus cremeus]TVY09656.1 nodulation protein NfeD [Paenibacillus cremeus]
MRLQVRRMLRARAILLTLGFALLLPLIMLKSSEGLAAAAEPSKPAQAAPVVVIPVHSTIETGLQRFLERAFQEAQEARAVSIVLDIDTLGGRVDSAEEIGQLVRSSSIPTVAFVHGKAVSAGSYIALNANQIVMQPGSSIGAASVVDAGGNEVESAKVVAHWASEMKAAAELRGRNPQIAEAMVDKNTGVTMSQINRTVQKGQIVSLTAEEAVKVGYAEKLAGNLQEVVQFIGGEGHPVVTIDLSGAEQFARFITQPWVSMLLLFLGIAGVAIELFVPGFGLPGIMGLLGFGLYFFGHYIAGFAGVEDLVLFAIGILLLIIEVFVSSFGIIGILGAACLIGSVIMAAYNTKRAALNLGLAFVLAIIVVAIVIRVFKHRGVWNRFILREQLTTEKGYTAAPTRLDLIGQTGRSITPLRPAGTAMFGEERVDVVTAGDFIAAGREIVVLQVEGVRVIVREKPQGPV